MEITLKKNDPPSTSQTHPVKSFVNTQDNGTRKILNKVIEFYHNTLNQNQKIKNHLARNNITPQVIIKNKLGFSNGTLIKTIPEKGPIVESLKQAGVIDERGREAFLDCLIIPELDQEGSCVNITGRKITELKEEDLKQFMFKEQPAGGGSEVQSLSKGETEGKPRVPCGNREEYIEPLKEGIFIRYGERKYLIRGIDNSNHRQLKANIKAINGSASLATGSTKFHIDSFDLYAAKQRRAFAKEAALLFHAEIETTEQDLNQIIEKTESYIKNNKENTAKECVITDKDREQAIRYLKSPDLIKQLLKDFESLGCAGEETNKIMGYLSAVSRKLDDPLSLLILSRSAAGKSMLQDSILEFVPEEDRAKYTRITGQALFYKGETSLQHKLIAIEEEEGANEASYSIRAMQSSKFLTIASTIKDPLTGSMKTQEYTVRGPLSIILTTTRTDIDYETMNRFIILTIDESREQTRLIHKLQREGEMLKGLERDVRREHIIKKHHTAQRLLRPLKIVNPYAHLLTFGDERLRARRDHKKYLSLIKVITYLHQYQREIKTMGEGDSRIEYVEVTIEDIRFANMLAHEIFGKSLDELSPPARRLLKLVREMVKQTAEKQGVLNKDVHFTRRDIREYCKWSDWQIRIHLKELVDLEYLGVCWGRNGSRYSYELIYDGQGEESSPYLCGLIDIKTLRQKAVQPACSSIISTGGETL